MSVKISIVGLPAMAYATEGQSPVRIWQDNAQLTSVCDGNAYRLRDFLERWQNITCYATLQEMLHLDTPDIIHVQAWPEARMHLLAAMGKSLPKVLMIESPWAFDRRDALRLVNACLEKGPELVVPYPGRLCPRLREAALAVQNGILGPITAAHITYSPASGVSASDAVDLARQFLGEAHSVQAFADRTWKGFDAQLSGRLLFGREMDVVISPSAASNSRLDAIFEGMLGTLRIYNGGRDILIHLEGGDGHLEEIKLPFSEPVCSAKAAAIALAIELAEGKCHNPCDGENALKTLAIVQALQMSHTKDGELVSLFKNDSDRFFETTSAWMA